MRVNVEGRAVLRPGYAASNSDRLLPLRRWRWPAPLAES
jgi:hypothetical protein